MKPTSAELVKTCSSLIEVQSTDDNPMAIKEVIYRIREFFSDVPIEIRQIDHGGYPSLVISTTTSKRPQIMLHGHVDVVPGKAEQFQPSLQGNRLLGRGAVDMKGFVAVAMHVLRDLALSPYPPDIALMINTDEEIGGKFGAKHLVEEGWAAEQLINGDGGYGDAVTYAQKGIIQLTVEASAEPGLRYAPWHGVGAGDILSRVLAKGLEQLCPKQDVLTEENNWGSTASVLSIDTSPDNGSRPPRKATASVRVYWADDHTGQEVIELAKKAFHPLHVEGVIDAERVYLAPDHPDLLRFRDIWQQNLGRPIGVRADNGSSDAKWFAPLGIPILIMRTPGDGAHTDNEWLEVSALEPMYQTLVQYITEKTSQDSSRPIIRTTPISVGDA